MSRDLKCPTTTDVLTAMTHMVGEVNAQRIWTEACKATKADGNMPAPTELRSILNYIATTRGLARLAARSQLVRLKSFMSLNTPPPLPRS